MLDAQKLLNFLQSPESVAGDCGPDCPVHGKGGLREKIQESLAAEEIDLKTLDSNGALNLAIGAAAGAQAKIQKAQYDRAKVMQEQSALWLTIAERLDVRVADQIRDLQNRLEIAEKHADSLSEQLYKALNDIEAAE